MLVWPGNTDSLVPVLYVHVYCISMQKIAWW